MRATVAILMGFVILIVSSVFISGKINDTADIMHVQLDEAEALIHAGDWDDASAVIDQTFEYWIDVKDRWAIVLNHSTLNSIEIGYQRLQQFVSAEEPAFALAELKTLQILLDDIPQSEALRLNNIL